MTITADIHDVLHSWIVFATGLTASKVIPDKENSPEPAGPFFTVNSSMGENSIGMQDETVYTATGQYTTRGHRERMVSLHCYGTGAFDLLQAVKMTQDMPEVRAYFKAASMALVDTGNIRDLSGIRGSRYEQRGQMDLRVRYAQKNTSSVQTVETIEYDVIAGDETISDSVSAP